MIVLALLMIIVPTAIVFWQSPEGVRVWIASISRWNSFRSCCPNIY